ncbi:MAG: bifunctional hydroxymethylpyrimidine kinase/phosphomethylpyrimidine kinase [Deltaproteobacteria bacterium RBG_13_49_15]|nr:MAG: bifunctional hydroxymethylpyrimidine kinase/phosphomethylpyrimidine kinase [Deltaproteobacteria bacterium RBG_13_49_15]
MRTALTIAGSDSSGGAGIQADLKTFAAHGVYGMSVITAVTAQNTVKVVGIQEIRDEIVRDQILCLFEDVEIHAVKIGMVSSVSLIKTIAHALRKASLPPVVLDPVMISKSGYRLLKEDAQDALIEYLFPLSEVVTPNLHEAQALVGESLTDIAAMKSAAKRINTFGAKTVVIKGGHLGGGGATDVFFDGTEFFELKGKRIATKNTHGTGCTFSSAIAANLALGKPIIDAVYIAKAYVTGAIEHALPIGKGCGPTHHFFDLYTKAGVDNGR